MLGHRLGGALVSLGCLACSGKVALLEVPVTAGQVLVAALAAGGEPRVQALTLDPGSTHFFISVPSENTELLVLEYRCALGQLSLADGPIVRTATGRLLPSPDAARRGTGGGPEFSWEPLPAELPLELADFRVEYLAPSESCAPLTNSTLKPAPFVDGSPTVLVPLGGDRVLLGTSLGTFYSAAPNEAPVPLALSASLPHLAGFVDAQGTIWLSGDGTLAHGTLEGGFRMLDVRSSTQADAVQFLAGPRDPSVPFELFVLRSGVEHTRLERFDGQAFQTLAVAPTLGWNQLSLVWVGPGEVLLTGFDSPQVASHFGGRMQPVPSDPREGRPAGSAWIGSRYGAVVGTDSGIIKTFDPQRAWDAAWGSIPAVTIDYGLRLLAPLDDGLLAVSDKGTYARYLQGRGIPNDYCEPLQFGTEPRLLAPIDSGYAIAEDRSGFPKALVTFLFKPAAQVRTATACPSR